MIVEELYKDTIYPQLKEYVEANSIYSPLVTKTMPQESKVFPIVPVKLLPSQNTYNNLSYGEETYRLELQIEIYAIDTQINNKKVSKRTICDEVTSIVANYFHDNYRVTINISHDVANVDDNVHRNVIIVSGTLDTKYGENNLVIYPR